jgi:small subunit ribosomal protein S1
MPNPWDSIDERYRIGDLVEGVITSIKNFGVFVRLATGLEGLIHVSEMDGNPQSTLTVAQTVLVRIVAIDPHRERISLSLSRVTAEEYLSWMMHHEQSEEKIVDSSVDENSF